eukprot:TRINITY_DN22164_c0_g1_i1.p1 TRINITY_DN22164_c0_g1~~TRINITY_DN22164_c0_g1_i1.p1  ORF type:complete len:229 (+),score=30.29 TRINITY_DN22164_c0_g1_i1:299-985(+)
MTKINQLKGFFKAGNYLKLSQQDGNIELRDFLPTNGGYLHYLVIGGLVLFIGTSAYLAYAEIEASVLTQAAVERALHEVARQVAQHGLEETLRSFARTQIANNEFQNLGVIPAEEGVSVGARARARASVDRSIGNRILGSNNFSNADGMNENVQDPAPVAPADQINEPGNANPARVEDPAPVAPADQMNGPANANPVRVEDPAPVVPAYQMDEPGNDNPVVNLSLIHI